jgi:hypothetical protein
MVPYIHTDFSSFATMTVARLTCVCFSGNIRNLYPAVRLFFSSDKLMRTVMITILGHHDKAPYRVCGGGAAKLCPVLCWIGGVGAPPILVVLVLPLNFLASYCSSLSLFLNQKTIANQAIFAVITKPRCPSKKQNFHLMYARTGAAFSSAYFMRSGKLFLFCGGIHYTDLHLLAN